MFGNKLRAWMEAVRPKKKQHRKEKQGKNVTSLTNGPNTNNHTVTWENTCLINSEKKAEQHESKSIYSKSQSNQKGGTDSNHSRYSVTNLSSPESAYSTGYSTDGTSPGAPPDYLLNSAISKSEVRFDNQLNSEVNAQYAGTSKTLRCLPNIQLPTTSAVVQETQVISGKEKTKESLDEKDSPSLINSSFVFCNKILENTPTGLVSPRQRNRIRTNPWLPGGTSSAAPSPLPVRQDVKMTPVALRNFRNSPIQHRYLSPATHRRSLSSSSCSSLSGPNLSFDHHIPRSLSDEDDCTLNEMMGKYDESYVYEKETDILSDSDPTDCESDIDTGQDGGDEDDTADVELDFIDNGSYVDLDCKSDNTGHCSYFMPFDMQKKRSSRRRTTRRTKESNERKRRPSTSRKCYRHSSEKSRHSSLHQDGSKSAGATPISVRRSSLRPNHFRSAQDECLTNHSNSVCLQKDSTILIDKRDREADLKYRELIGQAEQIIRTMNINGLSPRRLPGPTNKRVELLRSTECAKPEVLFKSKPADETLISNSNSSPSTAIFKNTRFSPKKNHITNFIINNSPVLVRKELQGQSPMPVRRNLTEEFHHLPLAIRKQQQHEEINFYKKTVSEDHAYHHSLNAAKKTVKDYHEAPYGSNVTLRKNHLPKSILHKAENGPISILSPRHRRAIETTMDSSSSDEEFQRSRKKLSKSCPQSEPVRRKVYFGRNTINIAKGPGKTVAFNLNTDMPTVSIENKIGSSENLRHQVLLNTIQSLKKNLEDHSASLQQNYRSTQSMYKYGT